MKKVVCIVTIFLSVAAMKVSAQGEAEMKAWQEYMTPGKMHEMLAKFDGDWNMSVSMWMAPGAPAQESKATCHNEMIMGGRYQRSTTKGDMMGMPFEGMGLVGYDNGKNVFISTWVDNFGTGVMTLEGTWNAKTKTIEFSGKCVDPMTGKDQPVKETMEMIDDNTQVMQMFMAMNGTEFKTMEIKFTRSK